MLRARDEESQNTNSTSWENHRQAAMPASVRTESLAPSCLASGFHPWHPWWSSRRWSMSGDTKSRVLLWPWGTVRWTATPSIGRLFSRERKGHLPSRLPCGSSFIFELTRGPEAELTWSPLGEPGTSPDFFYSKGMDSLKCQDFHTLNWA